MDGLLPITYTNDSYALQEPIVMVMYPTSVWEMASNFIVASPEMRENEQTIELKEKHYEKIKDKIRFYIHNNGTIESLTFNIPCCLLASKQQFSIDNEGEFSIADVLRLAIDWYTECIALKNPSSYFHMLTFLCLVVRK